MGTEMSFNIAKRRETLNVREEERQIRVRVQNCKRVIHEINF